MSRKEKKSKPNVKDNLPIVDNRRARKFVRNAQSVVSWPLKCYKRLCHTNFVHLCFRPSDDDSDSDTDQDEITTKTIASKLDDLTTCNSLVNSHGGTLQRLISELVDKDSSSTLATPDMTTKETKEAHDKLKLINEKAQLFRITSNAMINVSIHYCC